MTGVTVLLTIIAGLLVGELSVKALDCPQLRQTRIRRYSSEGATRKYKCLKGYLLGSETILCSNGHWSNPPPKCVGYPGCAPWLVEIPDNVRVQKPSMYNQNVNKFSCKLETQVLKGDNTVYCLGRRWKGTIPQCVDPSELTSCDFENDDLCGWIQEDQADQFSWIRGYGQTPSGFTGPTTDHTYENLINKQGHYMYIEASNMTHGDTAHLLSPIYEPQQSGMCLYFWYHMYNGFDEKEIGSLEVLMKLEGGQQDSLFKVTGNHGNQWLQGSTKIPKVDQRYWLIFSASTMETKFGDIAIDDIRFSSDEPEISTTVSGDVTEASTTQPPVTTIPTMTNRTSAFGTTLSDKPRNLTTSDEQDTQNVSITDASCDLSDLYKDIHEIKTTLNSMLKKDDLTQTVTDIVKGVVASLKKEMITEIKK